MLKNLFCLNKASVGRKSNGNAVIQNSEIYNPVFCSSGTDLLKTMGQLGRYDLIEQHAIDYLSNLEKTHPLYPTFSAKPNGIMRQLISTPETDDAFTKYPKNIKGTFLVDHKKYPHMDKAETPWEYAYRTQTKVELKTTAYKEYLGDMEDPFPLIRHTDGMRTIIAAPEFPPAIEATIESGTIAVPVEIRRKPSLEYGKIVFGTVSRKCGFDFTLTAYDNFKKTDINIEKNATCELKAQILREKLLDEIRKTKVLKIMVGSRQLFCGTINDDDITANIFTEAATMVKYLECLSVIEKYTSCKFDLSSGDVYEYDYRAALMLASSLEGKWFTTKQDFDDTIRCDYDCISNDIFSDVSPSSNISFEGNSAKLSIQGHHFSAEKIFIVFTDAKINNIASIIKSIKRKRKEILITFRPSEGKEYFYKSCKYEEIQHISEA